MLRDGSVVRGKIIRQDSSVITVQVRKGIFSYVEADQVVQIGSGKSDFTQNKLADNQASSTTVFVLRDSTHLPGKFVRRDKTMITVRKQNGQLTYFEPELLVRVDTVRTTGKGGVATGGTSGKPAYANQFSPFLLSNPTAFNIEKGRLVYRNTLVILNELDYGITKNWSVGASLNPLFGSLEYSNSARESIFVANYRFSTKLTFPIGEQFRFGVNAIYQPQQKGNLFRIAEVLIAQGIMSFGSSQRNVTLGYGMRLFPRNFTYKQPFISTGVMHKISRNLTFVSDNIFYLNPYATGSGAELSVALRFDRFRHAFDIGAFSAIQSRYQYSYGSTTSPTGTTVIIYSPTSVTQAYFYPYLGYKLLIGKK
ncbi:hypothetical protein GCM10028807_12400 [Spirosoma daeguense]